jgi:hypothetical protein
MKANRKLRRPCGRLTAITGAAAFILFVAGLVVPPVAGADDSATPPPTGGNPAWEALAQSCYQGVWRACDDLARQTGSPQSDPKAAEYNLYGWQCGGRIPMFITAKGCTGGAVTCVETYRPCH